MAHAFFRAGRPVIEPAYFWICTFLLAIGSFAIRFSIIALAGRKPISDRVKELFTFIPAAILPAFVAPTAFFHEGAVGWLFGKERLIILLCATALCYFHRSTIATIIFGLAALFLVTRF